MPTSLNEHLTFVSEIKAKSKVLKIFRSGHDLLFDEQDGWLEVFDTINATISHTFEINEIHFIEAIVAIDKTHYLLASRWGLFKYTKENIIEHYYQGKDV